MTLRQGKMQRFDRVDSQTAQVYPGHLIVVWGDVERIVGEVVPMGHTSRGQTEPLEAAIHNALLIKQRDALPIAVRDDLGLWPPRLGQLVVWDP